MIKRILIIFLWGLFIPIILSTFFLIPISTIYAIGKYIITGKDCSDDLFSPVEFTAGLLYDFIEFVNREAY